MIQAIIVDDEKGARESLAKMVEKHCKNIEVLSKPSNIETAYEAIMLHHPALVFLDIEMPNGNAFDLLEKFKEIDFDIIFTTAYDHYAIRAIKFSAVDYLLKPIDPEELVLAVERFQSKTQQKELIDKKMKTLLSNIKPGNGFKRLAIPEADGLVFVNLTDIIRIESINNYTLFILNDKRELLATRSMAECEQLLADENFLRIHRSHLINLNQIKKYIKGDGGFVVMSNDSQIEVSRRAKNELLDRIGHL